MAVPTLNSLADRHFESCFANAPSPFTHFYLDSVKAEDYKSGSLPKAWSSAPSSPCGKLSQPNNC